MPANSALLNGVGTFQAVLHTAGAQTIAATDTVTASITGASGTITVAGVGPGPMLAISKTHTGNFTQGQHSAQYTVTVSNAANGAATNGTVTVTDTALSALGSRLCGQFFGHLKSERCLELRSVCGIDFHIYAISWPRCGF